jgi:hypothetical protein
MKNEMYFWNEETIVTLNNELKGVSETEITRYITDWIEDNCEIEDDLNYMVADLITKIKEL